MIRRLILVNARMGLYTNLAWSGGLILYAAVIAWVYPSLAGTVEVSEYLSELPPQLIDLFGLADIDLALTAEGFFTFAGYLSTDYLNWWPIMLGVYAVIVGGGLVAREAERGTLEVLLSHPIRRSTFILTKAFTQIGAFLALAVVSTVAILVSAQFVEDPPEVGRVVTAHAIAVSLVITIFAYSTLLSAAFLKSGRAMGVAGILTLLLYVMNVLSPALGPFSWVENLSPFNYYDPLRLMNLGEVNVASLAVYGGVSVLALATAAWAFEQRDLVT